MWRVLIILGLTVATSGVAEARGFRLSFRPRLPISARPVVTHAEGKRPGSIWLVRRRAEDPSEAAAQKAATSTSVLDGIGRDAGRPLYMPVADKAGAVPAKKAAVSSEHWCDNGSIVGTGTGFCVLKIKAGAPS